MDFITQHANINFIILATVALPLLLYCCDRYFSGAMYKGIYPDLNGKFAIVTGGNSGIGVETVKVLCQSGCEVLIGARDQKKSRQVIQAIKKQNKMAQVSQAYLDLADLESVKNFATNINVDKIDYLVNNAGVMGIRQRKKSKQGFQMHYAVNHLGHFYLTHLLWPKLMKSQQFRIVNVSSMAHKRVLGFLGNLQINFDDMNFEKEKYSKNVAYSRSKLYNILFAQELAKRNGEKGLILSLHPGVVRTGITRHITDGFLGILLNLVNFWFCIFTKSPYEGAQTTIYCLLSPKKQLINGSYYSECRLAKHSEKANELNGQKLWQISERDCGIVFGKND